SLPLHDALPIFSTVLQRPCAVVVRLRSLRKDSQIASGLVNASVHIAATSRSVTLDSASNGPRGSLFTVRAGCRTDAGGLPVGCGSDAIGFESSAGFV